MDIFFSVFFTIVIGGCVAFAFIMVGAVLAMSFGYYEESSQYYEIQRISQEFKDWCKKTPVPPGTFYWRSYNDDYK